MEYSDPLIGTTVGNYEIKTMIGEGAMGQVYLGEHPQIGRKVAVKVLIASLSANPEMADRFLSEAKAVNTISHPNIIQVFDFGKLPDGRLYLTMEFLEGKELERYIEEEAPFELQTTLEIFRQIASALDAVHKMGIVHRDLKPDNIFVMNSAAGKIVKLLDFGVAKLLEPDMGAKHKTATGLIMGTPSYMSPEQAAGRTNEITPKSDLYSLAIIIYQMLSARLPIEADIVPQVLVKHITEPPTPINEYIPDFPENLWVTLERSLAKAPEDRYESVIDFFNIFQQEASKADPYIIPEILESKVGRDVSSLRASLGGKHSSSIPPSQMHNNDSITIGENINDFPKTKGKNGLIAIIIALLTVISIGSYFLFFKDSSDDNMDMNYQTESNKIAKKSIKPNVKPDVKPNMKPDIKPDMKATKVIKKEYELQVVTSKKKTKVKVLVDGKVFTTQETPFKVKIKEGSEVVLKPSSMNFTCKKSKIIVNENKKIVLQYSRRSLIRSKYKRKKTKIVQTPIVMKPIKKPPMKKPKRKTMQGVGTIKVHF